MKLSRWTPEPANMSAVPKTDDTDNNHWRPGASLDVLKTRATLLARIRSYFEQGGVLEVDTPALSRFVSSDPAIESFRTEYRGPHGADGLQLYLHTSPEFFMKRLLAAGSGPIFQLVRVFRNGEVGQRHNPEFLMLEWYRPDMDYHALMDDVDGLLAYALRGFIDYRPAKRLSYRQWFLQATGLDPWLDGVAVFRQFAKQQLVSIPSSMNDTDLDSWLDLLVTHWLEPHFAAERLFVFDYPPSQAALAQVREKPIKVAERFELFFNGVELANGFQELTDPEEQRQRFEAESRIRERAGQREIAYDEYLLAALRSGLTACSGVAIGFDRLVMLAAGLMELDSAMPFSFRRT